MEDREMCKQCAEIYDRTVADLYVQVGWEDIPSSPEDLPDTYEAALIDKIMRFHGWFVLDGHYVHDLCLDEPLIA